MKLPILLSLTIFLALCAVAPTTAYARQERSQAAKDVFKHSYPCPSNGNNHGPCPGYVIDHIIPLACGGYDTPNNMQWQSVEEGKQKDQWERNGCSTSGNSYYRGSKGGCFTYSANGKKHYVNHSYCGY